MTVASTPAPDTVQPEVAPVEERGLAEQIEALLVAQNLKVQPLSTLSPLAAGGAPSFHVDEHIVFVPLTTGGMASIGSAENLEHAARTLDVHDDLLVAIEAALGISLEPKSVVPLETSFAVDRSVALHVGDGERQIGLFIAREHPKAASWRRAADMLPPDLDRLLVPVELRAVVVRLPIAELTALESGDAILLPSSMDAELGPAFDAQTIDTPNMMAGRFAIAQGIFTRGSTGEAGSTGFEAPLRLLLAVGRLPAIMLSPDDPRPAITLPALGPGMTVTLSVGGKPLASGEIVELAGQLAVLVGDSLAAENEDIVDDIVHDQPAAEGE